MEFTELLNHYFDYLHCTSKELSEYSKLSPQVISRYKSGNRKPAQGSQQLSDLANGFCLIAKERGMLDITAEKLLTEFSESLSAKDQQFETFCQHFNTLLEVANVNMRRLSSELHLDLSFLYKIRQGQRKPYDVESFSESISRYIVSNHRRKDEKEKIAVLLGCDLSSLQGEKNFEMFLIDYLTHSSSTNEPENFGDIGGFVRKMDEFNLDEFIRTIHFDELKIPKIPFYVPSSRSYYGVEEMRTGELDFFKAAVLSKSMDPIFMYNEMPMADTAEDMEFNKKWMFAIAMSIKKGLHLHVIHNLNRPFDELMLGLEAWLPIYMTGQVSPYYFVDDTSHLYHHMDYVAGNVALSGECIQGHHNEGKYMLVTNKDELSYYKKKAKLLLSKALPLMEIYREEDYAEFAAFERSNAQMVGVHRSILSSLPLYTLSEELLEKICMRSSLEESDLLRIRQYHKKQTQWIALKLKNGMVNDEIMIPSKEEFEKYPMSLDLSGCFLSTPLFYTYEEMLAHVELTKNFAKQNSTYTLQLSDITAFRNTQIRILEGKYAIMSKVKTPAIHFVMRLPTLVHALQHFRIAVIE
ncbi:MAG: hypothetical protein K6G30_05525 [Acetatifactor sp.]|nr:hypothetical protein [Acetatifactor sp.]